RSRRQGADPTKLARQISLFGRSAVGMPPPWVYEGTDGGCGAGPLIQSPGGGSVAREEPWIQAVVVGSITCRQPGSAEDPEESRGRRGVLVDGELAVQR